MHTLTHTHTHAHSLTHTLCGCSRVQDDIDSACSAAAQVSGKAGPKNAPLVDGFKRQATALIKSAEPVLTLLQRRDVHGGHVLKSGVELKHVKADAPTSRFALPIFNPPPS